MHRIAVVATTAVALFAPSASAQILEVDSEFGLGTATRDVAQNLDFLDLTLSTSRSYADVSTQFGVGGDFEGWRHATGVEVATLVDNWGFTPAFDPLDPFRTTIGDAGVDYFGGVGGLVTLLGQTDAVASSNDIRSRAFVSDQNGAGNRYRPAVIDRLVNDPSVPDVFGGNFTSSDTFSSPLIGHWLVRDVPAPGALALFAGAGLVAARRRRA